MDNVIDTLKINIEADSSKAVDGIERLSETLEKLKDFTSGASRAINKFGKNIGNFSTTLNGIEGGAIDKLKRLRDTIGSLSGMSKIRLSDKLPEQIVNIGVAVDCLKDVDFSKLNEMAEGLSALRGVGNVRIPRVDTADTTATQGGTDMNGEVHMDSSTVTDTTEAVNELNSALGENESKWAMIGRVATTALGKIDPFLKTIKSRFKELKKKFSQFATMVKKRIMYRAINAVISAITSGFKEGVQNVYQFSKALGGNLASSLDTLATSFNYLKNSIGAMAAPIINMLAPYVDKLIDKFVDLLNVINQVFARLSGATTWTKAVKVTKEFAEATDEATKANNKLKKAMLGIDELNVLPDNSDKENGSDAGISFEEVPLDTEYVDGVIKKLKDILWYVGAVTAGIKAWGLAWDIGKLAKWSLPKTLEFAGGLTLAVAGLTVEIKGLIDIISEGINWQNFLESIGGGGAVVAGGALIGASFGSAAIGAGVGAIIAGIPMYIGGIWSAIKDGIDWLSAALIGAGATATGAGIGAIIGACGGPIGAGIGALIGLAVGLVTDGIILLCQHWDEVTSFLSNFFTVTIPGLWNDFTSWVSNAWNTFVEWFVNLPEEISNFFAKLWQPIKDYDWEGLGYNIGQWFGNAVKSAIEFVTVTFPNWITNLWNTVISALKKFFTETLPKFFKETIPAIMRKIGEFFTETIPAIINSIVSFFKEIPEKIWKAIKSAWTWLVDVGKAIIDGIWEGLQTVWQAIKDFVSGFVKGFKDALGIHSPSTVFEEIGGYIIDGLLNGIKKVWESVVTFFTEAFEGLKNLIGDAWEGITTFTSETWNSVNETVSSACDAISNGVSSAWDSISTWTSDTWDDVTTWTSNAWGTVSQSVSSACVGVTAGISAAWNNVSSWTSETWNETKETISSAWDNCVRVTDNTMKSVSEGVSSAWGKVSEWTSNTWTTVKDSVSNAWRTISNSTNNSLNTVKTTVNNTWSALKNNASSTWNSLKSTISSGWDGVKTATTNKWNDIKNNVSSTCTTLTTNISNSWNSIKSQTSSTWDCVKNNITGTWNTLKNSASTWGKDLCENMANGIKNAASKVGDAVSNVASKIKSFLGFSEPEEGALSNFHTYMPDMIELMVAGIKQNQSAAIDAVSNMTSAISTEIRNGEYSIGNITAPNITSLNRNDLFENKRLFVEHGVTTETVSSIGRNSTVENGDQISESVSSGVYQAVRDAMREQNNDGNGRDGSPMVVKVDGKTLFEIMVDQSRRETVRTGNNPLLSY